MGAVPRVTDFDSTTKIVISITSLAPAPTRPIPSAGYERLIGQAQLRFAARSAFLAAARARGRSPCRKKMLNMLSWMSAVRAGSPPASARACSSSAMPAAKSSSRIPPSPRSTVPHRFAGETEVAARRRPCDDLRRFRAPISWRR